MTTRLDPRYLDHDTSYGDAANLDELLTAVRTLTPGADRDRIMTELPTFGGNTPKDTAGIWSWDEDSLLVGEGTDDLEIVPRAAGCEWIDTRAHRLNA